MRKLPFIFFGAMTAIVSIGVGQGCGDSGANSGGAGPGGGNAGGATTQGNGGSTNSTTPTNTGGSTSSTTPTSTTPGTGGSTQGTGGSGGGSSACSGSKPVQLKVLNYFDWCSVTVNGGTASTSGEQDLCVAADADVPLTAKGTGTPQNGFELYDHSWHFVDGDPSGSGIAGMVSGSPPVSTAAVTVGANGTKCVWVCCRSTNAMFNDDCTVGSPNGPATDPCGP